MTQSLVSKQLHIFKQLHSFTKRTFFFLTLCLITINLLGCGGDEKNQEAPTRYTADPFISIWRLTSDNESITLPLRSGYTYNFTVDWGDDSSSDITAHDDSDITHTYAKAGDYTLIISGELGAWYFNNSGSKNKITQVMSLGETGWLNLEGAFEGCSNLVEVLGGDVSNTTNMSRMFKGATSLKFADFSRWNFGRVTNMSEILSEVTLPTEIYGSFLYQINNTSTQEDITLDGGNSTYDRRTEEFRNALITKGWTINDGGFSVFVSVWKISSDNESIALPLPSGYNYNFTVDWGDNSSSDITAHNDGDITHTYATAGDYTLKISGTMEAWNFKDNASDHRSKLISVKDLGDMGWISLEGAFSQCDKLEYLRGGNVSNVTNMSYMFDSATIVRPDTTFWITTNVTNMSSMFANTEMANPAVRRWDTSKVTNMSSMFANTKVANPDVLRWNTFSVTNMSSMFANTKVANPDVGGWNVSKVTNMSDMFSKAQLALPRLSDWDFGSITNMENILQDVTLLSRMYSQILEQINATSTQRDVSFHGGNSKYKTSAIDARAALTKRGWTISDGGECKKSEHN